MSAAPRAVILGGKTGLLGRPLTEALALAGFATMPTTRSELDPFDPAALKKVLSEFKADFLFNAVAYTAVDLAEDEPEAAYKLNRDLPALLATVCADAGIGLVHYSTDFVFNGAKGAPYVEDDPVSPESVYGASKLAGEQAIAASGLENYQILRTAWLFGPGKKNFVATILGLAKTRDELKVVDDQRGSPTYTLDLADWSAALALTGATGLFHAANAGETTWCGLAQAAVKAAGLPCCVVPIASHEYPQKAKRPSYSVLDTAKLAAAIGRAPRPWQPALADYVAYGTVAG